MNIVCFLQHIWRNPDGKLEVRSKCGMREEYDFVVWSGPPSGFEQVANVSSQRLVMSWFEFLISFILTGKCDWTV